jgi:hypothetical protein
MASITITGMRKTLGRMQTIAAAGKAATGPFVDVRSTVPYAFGIETGRRRSGRLARAAGGAYMFRKGLAEVRPLIKATIGPALLQGSMQVGAAKGRLQQAAVRAIRKHTPVVSGRLRGSVDVVGKVS